jgi:hypothetical protein
VAVEDRLELECQCRQVCALRDLQGELTCAREIDPGADDDQAVEAMEGGRDIGRGARVLADGQQRSDRRGVGLPTFQPCRERQAGDDR